MDGMDLIRARRGLAAKVAKELGIRRSAVSAWGKVPAERLVDIERITGISRHRLRPDICGPATDGSPTSDDSDVRAAA